jgi:hypothetical protein
MKNLTLNTQSLKPALARAAHTFRKYASVLIFLLFTGIYGYMIVEINSLSNPVIDDSAVAAESKALPVPRIDEQSAKKLESLKDNSVNVQTLFDQGRTNPFNE